MGKAIEEILSETPEPEAQQPTEPEAIVDPPSDIADPPSERLRDEHGRFAKKDETGVTAEAPKEPTQATAPPADQGNQLPKEEYSALRAVRDENKELKARLAALEASPKAQPQPVDFWEDPNTALAQRDEQLLEKLVQRIEQRQTVQRMDTSEAQAKAKYPDYDEAFQAFSQAVQVNPRLAVELAQHPDPGEFAYSKGKAALALERFGSVDDLLKAERAKWEAELRGAAPRPQLPSTTAADGSVGVRSGPEWGGIQPLKEILR